MINNSDNILSRLINSMYAMSPYASRVMQMHNQSMAQKKAQQQANMLPYLVPSVPVGTVGSQPHPLGLAKDIEPLPNALSDLTSLQPQQNPLAESPIPIAQSEPTQSVPQVQPRQDTTSSKSFWDQLRSPELLERLSDYALGYAMSDGTMAQDLANAAMNLRRGDMAREQRNQVNQTVEYLKSKGYSDEEATIMARNPQMLSALFTGGTDSIKHYNDGSSLVPDSTSPTGWRVVNHPGGKAYMDKEREAALRQHKNVYAKVLLDDIDYLQGYLEQFKDKATGNIALAASYAFSTSEQSDARQVLESIQSRIGLDRIDQMKMLSQRGALGLGNVSDKDIEMLKESLGKLNLRMSTRELKRRLSTIKDVLSRLNPEVQGIVLGKIEDTEDNMRNAVMAGNSENSTSQAVSQVNVANLPTVNSREEANRMPIGSTVIYNGQVYKRDR
ncbi:hypothetical protein [Bartonella vinsonii]|uniref:Uncharacterized protein n=1 Tax=Bartonella vinsonii TaxID=33047 RepID=A0A448V8C2_BARVI|nr:hypothetical protein [Bartonella vinsonii]VEJ46046.1 Uncharacterised protein [Bartonella vinsonii]